MDRIVKICLAVFTLLLLLFSIGLTLAEAKSPSCEKITRVTDTGYGLKAVNEGTHCLLKDTGHGLGESEE